MKKEINNVLKASTIALAMFSTAHAVEVASESIVCPQDTQHAQNLASYKNAIKAQVASQIDSTVNLDNSPLIYTNADAGCDLGFSMPGLPNIGAGLSGINACELLKSVTGDMVQSVNSEMQATVDQAIADVTGVDDLDFNFDINLQNEAEDAINIQ